MQNRVQRTPRFAVQREGPGMGRIQEAALLVQCKMEEESYDTAICLLICWQKCIKIQCNNILTTELR